MTEKNDWLGMVGALATIMFTLIGGISVGAYWAAGQTNQMNDVQRRVAAVEGSLATEPANKVAQADRLARIEEHILELKGYLSDQRSHITAIETYLYTGIKPKESRK